MPLSPIDVTQQTFRVSLRGYDEGEVDSFLDEVVSSMKEYDQRLRDADERVSVLEEQLQANRETEEAMRRAFVVAQRTADEIVAEARLESDRVVSEANAQASEILTEASTKAVEISSDQVRERDQLQGELTALRATVATLKNQMRNLAQGVLPELEQLDDQLVETAAPAVSAPSSLSARVAELSSAEEVAEHIPPFASVTESMPSDRRDSADREIPFFASEPALDADDDLTDAGFEADEAPVEVFAAPTPDDEPYQAGETPETMPTEEVPRFGTHRAEPDRPTFAPSSGGWLTSPNEPLPGRGMDPAGAFATGEVPTVAETDPWTDDAPAADWEAETSESAEQEPEPAPRRRPWERDT
ncbi:MAG: DivIVA domain-containing protein [Acidimicrobiia bacterium]|nr:DivIVA domain-containing protein [Acidimicrobiia bacterium]